MLFSALRFKEAAQQRKLKLEMRNAVESIPAIVFPPCSFVVNLR
jgi:hypothetical protein